MYMVMKMKNTTRPDMAEGCNEKMDLEFAMWILRDGRTKRTRERYKNIQEKYGAKTVVIKNQKELDTFIAKSLD